METVDLILKIAIIIAIGTGVIIAFVGILGGFDEKEDYNIIPMHDSENRYYEGLLKYGECSTYLKKNTDDNPYFELYEEIQYSPLIKSERGMSRPDDCKRAILEAVRRGEKYKRMYENKDRDIRMYCIDQTQKDYRMEYRINKADMLYDYILTGEKSEIK
nr:MAG TPA: hypothetical protein [Caudoviricetes sp.]